MNDFAFVTQLLPQHADCPIAWWAKPMGAAVMAATVVALEAWLRVPIQPLIDAYRDEALSRAVSMTRTVKRLF